MSKKFYDLMMSGSCCGNATEEYCERQRDADRTKYEKNISLLMEQKEKKISMIQAGLERKIEEIRTKMNISPGSSSFMQYEAQ